jgi:predicted Zn finger-like uncharacterized protein
MELRCPLCHAQYRVAEGSLMEVGGLGVCHNCRALVMLDEALQLTIPTDEDRERILGPPPRYGAWLAQKVVQGLYERERPADRN